jgi:hypothetical protein
MIERTRTLRLRAGRAALIMMAWAVTGCSGDGPFETGVVLTSVEFLPSASVISLQQPLNTVVLEAVPLDRDGKEIIGAGVASFASADHLVATVAADGTVSAVGTGQTAITATFTIAGVTKTASATVAVSAEREPALVGTWRGSATRATGTSGLHFQIRGDASMAGVGDANWNNCPIEGEWELAGDTFVIEAVETACGSLKLTFTAPLTSTQHIGGDWDASNGVTGTFSLARE